MSNDFGTLLAAAPAIKSPALGEIIAGKVIRSDAKMILVDLGEGQFTGVISGMHMHSSTDDASALNPGDTVEAIVIGEEHNSGLFILSLRKASQMKLIKKLHSNFDTKEIITVIPNEANKGGLLIDLDGIKGFIPVSQLTPVHYPRVEGADPEKILEHLGKLVGKPFKVRVINVDKDGKKIIFSEKAAVEEQRLAALATLKVGDVVEGAVSGILTYGLFITFNGVEGLVHVSEIDWGHVSNPSKFAKIGDAVKVQVIGIEGDKISLSMKRLRPNPWQILQDKFKVGDIVEAPVMRISQFGVFVSLDGGISGLIHLSEISSSMVKNIEDHVKVGETIKAKIITFDPTAKRIGLSIKALEENASAPAETASEEAPKKKAPAKKKEEATEEAAAE
ncbi:MAG: S1 RNA-binding domain-containing protein [Patescibacteria group bacterium]